MYNTLPIAPFIDLSKISRLLVSMSLAPTPVFKAVGRLAVLLREIVSFTKTEHVPVFESS